MNCMPPEESCSSRTRRRTRERMAARVGLRLNFPCPTTRCESIYFFFGGLIKFASESSHTTRASVRARRSWGGACRAIRGKGRRFVPRPMPRSAGQREL